MAAAAPGWADAAVAAQGLGVKAALPQILSIYCRDQSSATAGLSLWSFAIRYDRLETRSREGPESLQTF